MFIFVGRTKKKIRQELHCNLISIKPYSFSLDNLIYQTLNRLNFLVYLYIDNARCLFV